MIRNGWKAVLAAIPLFLFIGCKQDGDAVNSFGPERLREKCELRTHASLQSKAVLHKSPFNSESGEQNSFQLIEFDFEVNSRKNNSGPLKFSVWTLTTPELIDTGILNAGKGDSFFICGTRVKDFGEVSKVASFPHYSEFLTSDPAKEFFGGDSTLYDNYRKSIGRILGDQELRRRFEINKNVYYSFDAFHLTGLLKNGEMIFYLQGNSTIRKSSSEFMEVLLR